MQNHIRPLSALLRRRQLCLHNWYAVRHWRPLPEYYPYLRPPQSPLTDPPRRSSHLFSDALPESQITAALCPHPRTSSSWQDAVPVCAVLHSAGAVLISHNFFSSFHTAPHPPADEDRLPVPVYRGAVSVPEPVPAPRSGNDGSWCPHKNDMFRFPAPGARPPAALPPLPC